MNVEISVEKTKSPKTQPTDNLGFGKYFSDHMLLCYGSVPTSGAPTDQSKWESPRIVPYAPLPLDPGASVLHYGQALFEGMKAFRGDDGKIRLFRPEMNFKRLRDGAARLCMQAPDKDTFLQSIEKFVEVEKSWIPKAPGTALYLRPTLIGTEGFLGVRPSNEYLFYIVASPVGGYYGEGIEAVKIWVETQYARCAPGGIGAVKAGGNYAASLLAALDAKKRGFAQVLWLDAAHHRFVEEVGTMNVFFAIGDKVITPPLAGTILPGVMRDSAIQLLKKLGHTVEERAISLDEVMMANERGLLKEVFGTGTAASISPVGQLGFEDRTITIADGRPGAISRELYATITDIQYGRKADEFGWTVEVKG
ncbi:MAG: branched-chain amino acid aminotransferase [Proteobacteria bacterium]|nr:MAG: branched-chain amino acid aminotransferase [Pseudomonadota bacterium]